MLEVMEGIGVASNGFEEGGACVEGLDAGRVEGEGAVTVSDGVGDAAGAAVRRGAVHVALGEEPLRGAAAGVDELGEVADGFRVEAGVEGGEGGGAAPEEELDVGEEVGDGLGFG